MHIHIILFDMPNIHYHCSKLLCKTRFDKVKNKFNQNMIVRIVVRSK